MPTIGAAVMAAERDGRIQGHRNAFPSSSPREIRRNKRISKDETDHALEMYKDRALEAELTNKRYVMLLMVLAALLFLCLPTFFILGFASFGKTKQNKEATFEDLHRHITDPPNQEKRYKCDFNFPRDISGHLHPGLGDPLLLSPLIQAGQFEEAARKARVPSKIFGEVETFSGFLTVNRSSHLYMLLQVAETAPSKAPLILWLQGGPGWSSMYGAFKEIGAFYIGRTASGDTYLEANPLSWNKQFNVVFIDNPIGVGFSYSHDKNAFPSTDQQVGQLLVEALAQLVELLPYLIPGATQDIPIYAFGESYGGAYVLSLAKILLAYRDAEISGLGDLNLVGLGIGNGFISPNHQVQYAQFINSITYLTKQEKITIRRGEIHVLNKIKAGDYSAAYTSWQQNLKYIQTKVMNLTNLYDYSYDGNYLTSHEYACFLDKPTIRQALHVGSVPFLGGHESQQHLDGTVMDPAKAAWLGEVLSKLKVILYAGNMDVIVNLADTAAMVRSIAWDGRDQFLWSTRRPYWVYGPGQDTKLAGYFNTGGNLTVLVVRRAGHMVPISQPRVASQIIKDFVSSEAVFRGGVLEPTMEEQRITCPAN